MGFLFYNFFPARIFMGDSGSLFLGFMLGVITVIGTLKTMAVIALFVPIIMVGLPLADLIFSVLRRFRNKQPLTQADRQHFHHRLLDLGWTQREIVLLIYILTLLLEMTAILLTVFKLGEHFNMGHDGRRGLHFLKDLFLKRGRKLLHSMKNNNDFYSLMADAVNHTVITNNNLTWWYGFFLQFGYDAARGRETF
ncbi:MAG: MraY family glycosyltransferase [Elusimicrobiota bacterium]